jgi:hypothetical protein
MSAAYAMPPALSFKINQNDSGLLKYARRGAEHDGGASERLKRAQIAALDRECHVDRYKPAAATPRP